MSDKDPNKAKKSHWFYRHFGKRFLDFTLSLIAVIFLSPILLVLFLLVRIFHGSPIFFKPARPGKDEKIFRLYKLRTMTNATDENGNLLPDKDRLTMFGKFLRASSLDELPEIFNILKGDMSIIGPRPLAMKYLPYYTEEERGRHSVRPGLTGLAQVSGRNNLYWDKRILTDLEYVRRLSLKTDIEILLTTVKKVIKKEDVVVSDETKSYHYDTYRVVETEKIPHPAQENRTFPEIGSDFWENGCVGTSQESWKDRLPSVTDQTLTFSGRSAIELALQDAMAQREIRKAYLPSYCSLSLVQSFIRLGIPYDFYDVSYNGERLVYRVSKKKKCDLLVLMPYFGAGQEQIEKIARHFHKRGILVLEEITHAFLGPRICSENIDYMVLSLRKWTGVPAGGWLGKREGTLAVKPDIPGEEAVLMRKEAMQEKAAYIAGQTEDKIPFLEKFARFESSLVQIDSRTMLDEYSMAGLNTADWDQILARRNKNAAHLAEGLRQLPEIQLLPYADGPEEAPLYLPVLLPEEDRDPLKKYLEDEGVYARVTWPERIGTPTGIRTRELSLPVDQRYEPKDMDEIVRLIQSYFHNKKEQE